MQRSCTIHYGLGIVALVAGLFAGCAEEVKDVNRVQPHYVEKSALDGEWYFRQTMVDRPPQYSYLFTGIEGALEKVRWEIREGELIAYRTHSAVRGLENDATFDGADYKGSPVAVFTITKHFDIVRSFNSSTGEQSNLLAEDTSLRPWYEREYMRVDWSSNSLEGPVDLGGFFNIVQLGRTHTYHPRDAEPHNPDRLQIRDDFIFFTNQYVVNDGGYGCFMNFGSGTAGGYDNCGAVEVKIRNAFVRIDPEEVNQFEPVHYEDRKVIEGEDGDALKYVTVSVGPDKDTMVDVACTEEVLEELNPEVTEADCKTLSWDEFSRFGYFRSERHDYDRRVGGFHDHSREFYANHHQVWKKTKNEDGTVIPMTDRELRPVVYYLNPNFPEDLKSTAIKIGHDWNNAFMAMATSATGKSKDVIQGQLRDDTAASAVFIEGDELAGGALFQVRENSCSIKGIGEYLQREPSMNKVALEAADGEVRAGNLERTCSALNYYSVEMNAKNDRFEIFEWQQMGDPRHSYVWWVHEAQPGGPLGYGPSSADIENGRIISGNAHVYGAALDSYARSAADAVRALNGDLDLHDLMDGQNYIDWIQRGTSVADNPARPTEEMQKEISRRIGSQDMEGYRSYKDSEGRMDKAAMLRHMRDRLSAPSDSDPMARAFEQPVDYQKQKLEAVKNDPRFRSLFMDQNTLAVLGPLFGWTPGQDIPEEMETLAFDLSVNPNALNEWQDKRFKFYSERNVYMGDFLDDSIVGQALELKGLPPEEVYQILRREIFEAVMLHEIGHTVGLRHNFKASFDALNYQDEFWQIREQYPEEEWKNARLPEHRYASIMDYGSRFNSDTKGLGKYDVAAIKYLYGKQAEEFHDDVVVPGRLDLELEFNDYSKIPDMLGGDSANITKRRDVSVDALIEKKKGGIAENARLLAENRERPVGDYWVDRTVPYYFCTDSYRGDYKCNVWDEGSNHTEAVQGAIQRYWNYYIFNSFRRGRDSGAFINSFFGRQNRVMDYLIYPWQFYYFYDEYPVDAREDLLTAAMLGLNFVNQVIGTPEPGQYCRYNQNLYLPADVFRRDTQLSCNSIEVGFGTGRDQYFKYSDDYSYNIDYIGSFFDKQNIMLALFMNSTRFFRVTDNSDRRAFSINYYRVFHEEMMKLFRDLMMGSMINWTYIDGQPEFLDNSVFGNIVVDGEVVPQLLVDPARFNSDGRATAADAPQIYSSVPFNIATRALLYGTIINSSRYDQATDFIEYVTVSEVGSGDDRDIADGSEQVVFVHPMTGQAYAATQTEDGRSLSYELLELANRYVEMEWEPAREAFEADPDNEDFARVFENIDRQLQDFAEMMDYLRELRSVADVGNIR